MITTKMAKKIINSSMKRKTKHLLIQYNATPAIRKHDSYFPTRILERLWTKLERKVFGMVSDRDVKRWCDQR